MGDEHCEATIIKCLNCGSEIIMKEGMQYCPKCGAVLSVSKKGESTAENTEKQVSVKDDAGMDAISPSEVDSASITVADNDKAHTKKKRNLKRALIILPILLLVLFGLLFATHVICFHEWTSATCTTPETCSICGKTRGDPLPHNWIAATCTTPKTCSVCGKTIGSALGHDYGEWSVTEEASWKKDGVSERVCTRCGQTETEVTEAYLKTVPEMNWAFKDFADTHLAGFEGLYADDSGRVWMIDCASDNSSEDLVELCYQDGNGDLLSYESSTLPSSISFVQFIPRSGAFSYNRIIASASAFLAAICNQSYNDTRLQLGDLPLDIGDDGDMIQVGETRKATTTICGANVTLTVSYESGMGMIFLKIEP